MTPRCLAAPGKPFVRAGVEKAPPFEGGGRGRGFGVTCRGGSVPEVLVDHVGQGLALDEVADVFDQGGEVSGGDHGGVAGGVWGDDDVGEVPERMIGRERLDLEDVERGAGEPAGAEGGHQVEVLFQAGRERLPRRISRVANLRRLMDNRGHRQAPNGYRPPARAASIPPYRPREPCRYQGLPLPELFFWSDRSPLRPPRPNLTSRRLRTALKRSCSRS